MEGGFTELICRVKRLDGWMLVFTELISIMRRVKIGLKMGESGDADARAKRSH